MIVASALLSCPLLAQPAAISLEGAPSRSAMTSPASASAACGRRTLGRAEDLTARPQAARRDLSAAAYKARAADSICGLDSLGQLSDPMSVRYEDVMDATPERVRMRKEKIDPASPQGEILESAARGRVLAACGQVMRRNGHCSAWKKISRARGGAVTDRTAEVVASLALVP